MHLFFFVCFLDKLYKALWKRNTIIFIIFALRFQFSFLFSQFITKPSFCKATLINLCSLFPLFPVYPLFLCLVSIIIQQQSPVRMKAVVRFQETLYLREACVYAWSTGEWINFIIFYAITVRRQTNAWKTNRQQVRKIQEQYWAELANGDATNVCSLAIQLSH